MKKNNLPALQEIKNENELAPVKPEEVSVINPKVKSKESFQTRMFLRSIKHEENRQKFLSRRKKSSRYEVDASTKEGKILKKANSKFWKILASGCIVLMVVIIVACLIDIFNFVRDFFTDLTLGNIVAGSITGVLVLLLIIFVVRPIVVALSTPVFTLDIVDTASKKKISKKNFKKLQQVAKNIIKTNDSVCQDSKNKLATFIGNKKELNNTLKHIYDTEINKDIQKTINAAATKTFITTAISQNSKFDMASVIIINVKMIMQICVKCGYHPTYARLSKLIVKVFRNALIAYAVQSLNLGELIFSGINQLANGVISNIPGLSKITSSITDGAANSLLTLRVGIITRKYLYEEYNIQAMINNPEEIEAEIVTSAVKEANENIDAIVSDAKAQLQAGK